MTAESRKKSAADRRDARNAKPDDVPRVRGKRNTKKWCRGKPGVEHKLVCRDYNEVKRTMVGTPLEGKVYKNWRVLMCAECGKEIDYYMPLDIEGIKAKSKPPWVVD